MSILYNIFWPIQIGFCFCTFIIHPFDLFRYVFLYVDVYFFTKSLLLIFDLPRSKVWYISTQWNSESLSNPIYSVQYSLLSKLARKPLGISCLCCWLEERFHNYSWELQSNTQWALLLLPINVDRGGNLYEPRGPLLPLPKPSGKHFSTIKGGKIS